VEEAGAGARPPLACLGDFLAMDLVGAAGDGSSPTRLMAAAPVLGSMERRSSPRWLASEVDFPSLRRSGGDSGQSESQAQEVRAPSPPVVRVGEIQISLRQAAAPPRVRERELLGLPREGHGDSCVGAGWAGPSLPGPSVVGPPLLGPVWAGLASSDMIREEPLDEGHVAQGQLCAAQMEAHLSGSEVDSFTPPREVLNWWWLPVGTLDRELGFPAAARDIQRHRFRAK
jgi:hypothetical protein